MRMSLRLVLLFGFIFFINSAHSGDLNLSVDHLSNLDRQVNFCEFEECESAFNSMQQTNGLVVAKPSLSHGRVAGQVLSGSLGSVGAFILGFLMYQCENNDDSSDHALWDCIAESAVTGYFVAPIGGALFPYVFGKTKKQTGSFGATLAGSYLGLFVGTALAFTLQNTSATLAVLPLATGIGATTGFNLSRKYRSNVSSKKAVMLKIVDYKF